MLYKYFVNHNFDRYALNINCHDDEDQDDDNDDDDNYNNDDDLEERHRSAEFSLISIEYKFSIPRLYPDTIHNRI